MKLLNELLSEAYHLGYEPKHKIPLGATKDWLKAIGATPADVQEAREIVMTTPEYETLIDLGLKDTSTDRAIKNGTIVFKMTFEEPATKSALFHGKERVKPDEYSKMYADRSKLLRNKTYARTNRTRTVALHYNVLPHGKVDFTAPNEYHRWPVATGKPVVVVGKPVDSIVKSMRNAMGHIARQVQKRFSKAERKAKLPVEE